MLNVGHWERSWKRSTPKCFHHLTDWDDTYVEHKRDPTCGNLFLHFLSTISAHIPIMQEAGTIRRPEKDALGAHGWLVSTSPANTRCALTVRANPWPVAYMKRIAGTCNVRRYKESPLTNERAGLSQNKEAQRELLDESNCAKGKIVRRGMDVVRICSFHLNNTYATESPALCEMLHGMVANCFHCQEDFIGGDGNAVTYKFGGSILQ